MKTTKKPEAGKRPRILTPEAINALPYMAEATKLAAALAMLGVLATEVDAVVRSHEEPGRPLDSYPEDFNPDIPQAAGVFLRAMNGADEALQRLALALAGAQKIRCALTPLEVAEALRKRAKGAA
jgi:hypothetical protein